MTEDRLESAELIALITSVFPDAPLGGSLVILVDVPDQWVPDHPEWAQRRAMAVEWYAMLKAAKDELIVENVDLVAYQNTGSNNADLPAEAFLWTREEPPASVEKAVDRSAVRNSGVEIIQTPTG